MSNDAFAQLGQLLLNNAVVAAMPVINSTLLDIEQNPAVWTNPASGFLKGISALAALQATLPTMENTSVTSLAGVIQAVIAAGVAKLDPTPAPTPASIAAAVVGS